MLFDLFVSSYGRPGVELSARHQEETVIQELHFLPEQVSNRQILVLFINRSPAIDREMEGVFDRVGLLNAITARNL